MDVTLLKTSELAFAEMLAESGVELIQYRNKLSSSRHVFETAQGLVRALAPRGVRLIVNDRPDIARLVEAGGVHIGQEDLNIEDTRAICGPGLWVGVSTHTLAQVEAADKTSADYIAVGPICATQTKQDPDPVVGTGFIRQARKLTRKPLVAIGGITLADAEEVFRAGADSIAVARDLICAAAPHSRAREFLQVGADVGSEVQ